MLNYLILTPILGLFFVLFNNEAKARKIGLLFSIITMYISLYIFMIINNNNNEYQYRENLDFSFIKVTLGIDGISLCLILLTTILMPIIIYIKETKGKEIIVLLLIIESILIMQFSVLDIFLFYIVFEILIIPMYILIGKYGSKEKREEAAYRFIIYSILGSLLLLISIVMLYVKYGSTNNEIIIIKLADENINFLKILFLTIFISFAIKVPVFPFHTWLPFVHVEAPTIGSMLLAGIILKIGIYGLIRYNIIIPQISNYYIPIIIIMAILSIIYGSLTTLRQIDMKKIIAYSSIVHMNYGTLGLYTNEIVGINGVNYLMISHGFVSSGLFLLVGILYKRYHTRILTYYKGLILTMPIYGTIFIILTIANISIPLTSSFLSEILIILGTIKMNIIVGIIITFALFFSTSYAIWFANRLLFGSLTPHIEYYIDITKNEILALSPLVFFSFFLGINSSMLLNLFSFPVIKLIL